MKWTDKQQKVIDTRDRNILVSAAAGSGKTAVLVERIIKMITDEENPTDVNQLLVVTFTRAAASEHLSHWDYPLPSSPMLRESSPSFQNCRRERNRNATI